MRHPTLALLLVGVIGLAPASSGQTVAPSPAPAPPGAAPPAPAAPTTTEAADDPGVPATPEVVQQIQTVLAEAVSRFEAKDTAGVLVHVSEEYRTGPFTKPRVRQQLAAMFGVYDVMQARVRIDTVRMVGDHAWVFSTGDVSGRVRWVGAWTPVIGWERELEVARREGGVWRLYGYQQ